MGKPTVLEKAAERAVRSGDAFLDELSNEEFAAAEWLGEFFEHIKWHILHPEHYDT